MVDEQKLSLVLSEFALTLATEFSISSILDHLVHRIVDLMPVTSAGVTLIGPGRDIRHVAASDEAALRYELLQTELGEGPCLLAYESGRPVAIADLARESRFPGFAAAASRQGLRAVFTFPLHHADRRLGALDLYGSKPGGLSNRATEAALTLANVASAYLINAAARDDASDSSDRMRHIALHDALTGLPNRTMLEERIQHAGSRAQRTRALTAVLFVDLDRFKDVNDAHGHEVGDDLLRAVAKRLAALVRPGDTLARIYGDEFVLLCEDVATEEDISILASRMRAAFAEPFPVGDMYLAVSASVGSAFASPGEPVTEILLAEADQAMYEVKREHSEYVVSSSHPRVHERTGSLPTHELAAALENGELRVVYQPIVRCADDVAVGLEALVRWSHPYRGAVPAAAIVHTAEVSGLIGALGAWILDRSSQEAVRWRATHPATDLHLSVNVSTYQLIAPRFVTHVRHILSGSGIAPRDLTLEVTENVLIEDSQQARRVLAELKSLGIRIALDDFGTGYSSLSYLKDLPIDILKIDRSFTADIGRSEKSTAMFAGLTDLAHSLGLLVVIEGVETVAQQQAAVSAGADYAQGYLYSRPMEPAQLQERLDALGPGAVLTLPPSQEIAGPFSV